MPFETDWQRDLLSLFALPIRDGRINAGAGRGMERNRMNKVALISLGCPKNQVDSELMLGLLQERGYELTDEPSQADWIIVNTCGFITSAKEESIEAILEAAEYKKTGRCKKLAVTGCLAQRYRQEILAELPEIDVVAGTADYHHIVSLLEGEGRELFGDINCSPDYSTLPRVNSMPFYTAYLKIADGCDNHCTYCVIPSIRGKYRSRPMEELVAEAEELAKSGVRELILVAQDTTAYGTDLYGERKLAQLLERLCAIEQLHWIRFHYGYPEGVTRELLEVMAAQPKICNYLDLPIQHCNDLILKRMGRRCTKEQLIGLFDRIREILPDAALRTSVIVGFPGETDQQFEELCEFADVVGFDRMGVFCYSPEEGTPAASMAEQVPEEVKEQRRDGLMLRQSRVSLGNNQRKLGLELEVLTEGFDRERSLYFGRTYADSVEIDGTVYFGACRELSPGEFVQVEIDDADEYDLYGRMIEE